MNIFHFHKSRLGGRLWDRISSCTMVQACCFMCINLTLRVFICPYFYFFYFFSNFFFFSSPIQKETKAPNTPVHPRYMHILTPPLSYFSPLSLLYFLSFFFQKITFSSSLQTLTTLLLKSSSTDTPHSHLKQKITETITLPTSSPHYSYYSSFL